MSHMIDYATLNISTITPTSGYNISGLSIKKKGGIVFFANAIQHPAITSIDNQTSAFTLPVGWRPSAVCNFIAMSYTGTSPTPLARVRIDSYGTVKISKIDQDLNNNAYVQMAPICYSI